MNELIEEAKKKMSASYEIFLNGIKGIRTGKANPSLLDGIIVSVGGGKFRLNQISTVNVVNAKTLSITVWDSDHVSDIKNAILSSGLNINPIVEGNVVRLVIPDLSEESRKSYVKNIKIQSEAAKVTARNIARDYVTKFKQMEKLKEMSEDDSKRNVTEIRDLLSKQESVIEAASKSKEDDIMSA